LPIYFNSKNPALRKRSEVKDGPLPAKSGQIISLSACADTQTSISAYNLERKKRWQGALTYAFSTLPKGTLKGDAVLKQLGNFMNREHFTQITTLSTNKSDVTNSNQITFPFPL
jgi:hypothetical protein